MSIQTSRIQLRRGTAAALAAVNEVLLNGEMGNETVTKNLNNIRQNYSKV